MFGYDGTISKTRFAILLIGAYILSVVTLPQLGLPDDSAWIVPIGIFYILFLAFGVPRLLEGLIWLLTLQWLNR